MSAPVLAVLSAAALALAACRPPAPPPPPEKRVRPPAAAGQFYPAAAGELQAVVGTLVRDAVKVAAAPVRIVLAPHAGLVYSGAVAAAAVRQLEPGFDRAVVVAANHDGRSRFRGFSVDRATHYAVPGLEVPVAAAARALAARPGAVEVPGAHGTHVVEIQLPFLAQANRGRPFELVPVIVGELSLEEARGLGAELAALAGPTTVFVFSVDLSHYHPYDVASTRDRACLDALARMDGAGILRCDTDGTQVLVALDALAGRLGASPRLVAYRSSGDVAPPVGDRSRVVGYGAVAWEEATPLSPEERDALLALARASLSRAVRTGASAEVPAGLAARLPRLAHFRGSFVTLKKDGVLRGCIGTLEPHEPLLDGVAHNALAAALRDPRFTPVRPEELPHLQLSVSVLERPRAAAGGPDLLRRLAAERPGVILEYAGRASTFLPAVWEELPDPAQFLSALCQKQGSPPTCWSAPAARFMTYGAEEIAEPVPGPAR